MVMYLWLSVMFGCASPVQSGGSTPAIDNSKNPVPVEKSRASDKPAVDKSTILKANDDIIKNTISACERRTDPKLCNCLITEMFVGKMNTQDMETYLVASKKQEPWALEIGAAAALKCQSNQSPAAPADAPTDVKAPTEQPK